MEIVELSTEKQEWWIKLINPPFLQSLKESISYFLFV